MARTAVLRSFTWNLPCRLAHPTRSWCSRLAALENDPSRSSAAPGRQGLVHTDEHDETRGECKRGDDRDRPGHAQKIRNHARDQRADGVSAVPPKAVHAYG